MKKALLALVLCLGLSMACASNASAATVTCPPGTLHAGQPKPTYAECNIDSSATTDDLMATIKNVLTVIFGLLGVVAVVVVIYGGFTFITSQGDAGKVMKGRNTILWGMIGLVVSVCAFVIVNFVLDAVGNGNSNGGPGHTITPDPDTNPGHTIQPDDNSGPGHTIQPN